MSTLKWRLSSVNIKMISTGTHFKSKCTVTPTFLVETAQVVVDMYPKVEQLRRCAAGNRLLHMCCLVTTAQFRAMSSFTSIFLMLLGNCCMCPAASQAGYIVSGNPVLQVTSQTGGAEKIVDRLLAKVSSWISHNRYSSQLCRQRPGKLPVVLHLTATSSWLWDSWLVVRSHLPRQM